MEVRELSAMLRPDVLTHLSRWRNHGFYLWHVFRDFRTRAYNNSAAGVVTIFQYGAGTAGIMRTLGKYMAGSGATFALVQVPFLKVDLLTKHSVFMGVGSIIRTETSRQAAEAWARSRSNPIVHARRDLPYSSRR